MVLEGSGRGEKERERERERERKSESLGVCQGVHGVYRGPGSKH